MNAPELHLPHLSASLHSDGLVLNETAADHYCGVGLLYAVAWKRWNESTLRPLHQERPSIAGGPSQNLLDMQALERLTWRHSR